MAQGPASNQQIFEQAFFASPRNYTRNLSDPSPLEDMLGSSQALDLLRQYLPERLGDTQIGQQLAALIPKGPDPESAREKVRRAVEAMPLGGYSERRTAEFDVARANDEALRRETIRVGQVPTADLRAEVETPTFRAGAAQAGGALLADATSDGARNVWWFLNAPQALGSLAVLYALHQGSKPFDVDRPIEGDKGPLLRHRGLRLAATVPAILGISMGIGNAGRMPGYKAAVPSEADPTQAADPTAEVLSRYFLGRTGALLPYDEFVKERPDVSRGEYEQYKAYLFGNAAPIKGTLEGIHGPEVTFMGKSIPVATGLLPAVAAAVGAGYGMRRGGQRLKESGAFKRYGSAHEAAADAYGEMKRTEEGSKEHAMAKAAYDAAEANRRKISNANDLELFKHAAGMSTIAMAGAGITGQLLESIRRATKGTAPEETLPEPPLSAP